MKNTQYFSKKNILVYFCLSLAIIFSLGEVKASSGIFQTYAIVNSGSGNMFYAGGINSDLAPLIFNNTSFGSFPCNGTLILNGGEVKTFKNSGSDVFGANINYRIYLTTGTPGSFIPIGLFFNADLGGGDQKWQTSAHNVNVLAGLGAGTYYLEVYWDAPSSDGTHFDSNFGNNFKATFTVIVPSLTGVATNVSCFGQSTGSIDLTISGGTPFISQSYTQNFNTLATSGTNAWTDNGTIANWWTNQPDYTAGSGTSTTGDLYSFGTGVSTERALGSVASGTAPATLILGAVRITNTSGSTLTSIAVNYTGEQWRNGGNTTPHKLDFTYQINAVDETAGSWTDVNSLDFTGPIATATAGALDGNAAANRVVISSAFSISLAAGATLWIRWADGNDAGSDHGLAIDDLTVSMSNGTSSGPYNIIWSNAVTTEDISGLAAGTYSVTVTDANGCTATQSFSVTQPSSAVLASAIATNAPCFGQNGSVDLTASGGTTPYTYSWSNSATTEDLASVPAGTYSVTVTDVKGCTATASAIVTQPAAVTATAGSNSPVCAGGTIMLTSSGGVSYSWSGPGFSSSDQNPSIFPAMVANSGTYTVVVTDASGCTGSASAAVVVNDVATVGTAMAAPSFVCPGGSSVISLGSVNGHIQWQESPNGSTWSNVAGCSDLYMSEYVEGTSNLKAIEIYNGTGAAVNLASQFYQLKFYFNGSLTPLTTISLSGTVAANDVYVVADDNASAAILAQADQVSTLSFYNGDDAIELVHNATVIDVIGQVGFDPGTEWGTGLTSTMDNTLRRKANLRCAGDPVGSDVFDPAIEWDGYATDNIDNLGQHKVNYTTGPLFSTTYYQAVVSLNNCADATSNTVQVEVGSAPVITTCPSVSPVGTDAGVCNAVVAYSAAVVTGNPAPVITYSHPSGGIFQEGTTTVTVTATNSCGTATCMFDIVVFDDEAPVANVASLPTVEGECSASVSAPSATDNCEGSITGTTTDPTSYSTQGTFIVNWTYDDGNGNISSQSQTVIVDDVTAPVADVASLPTAMGECSASVSTPTATDNCEGTITGTTTDPTSYSTQGTFIVNWTYDDGNGNTSSQSQTVIVDDVTAPVADVASLPTAEGECFASVSAPAATDNCEGIITGTTTDPTSYSTQGTFVVNWTYDDGNGNTSSQSQTVIVDDVTAPVADVASLPTAEGECFASVSAPAATDNCEGIITGTTTDPTSYTTQGTFVVNWTYDDGNGNTSSQTQTVIVDDVTAPTIVCPSNIFLPACVNTATWTEPAGSDNCAGQVVARSGPAPGSTFAPGSSTTIIYTVTDVGGNSASCSFTVTRAATLTVDAGIDENTYFGLTIDQTVSHTAIGAGGTPPYSYSWTGTHTNNTNAGLLCNQVNGTGDESFTVGSPGSCGGTNTCPAAGNGPIPVCNGSATVTVKAIDTMLVCVTITDGNGCTATDCFLIKAEDARCFAGNNTKLKICHKTNSPSNPCFTICVDENAWPAHSAHGDNPGKCNAGCLAKEVDGETDFDDDGMLLLFPNPTNGLLNIDFDGTATEQLELTVTNVLGQIMYSEVIKDFAGHIEKELDLTGMSGGAYFVIVRNGSHLYSQQIVLSK